MTEPAITAPAPATPEANPAQPPVDNIPKGEKVYVVKHPDGREEKWWGDKVQERLQKSIGLEKRVSDAAKYEQAFNSFVSKAQDPVQLLELLNHPDMKYDEEKQEALVKSMLSSKKPRVIEAVKRWLYENEVKPSLMDPKDREAMEWKNKAEALESDKLKREKEQQEQEAANKQNEIKETFRRQLGEAYRASGLPPEDFMVRQVLEKARMYIDVGKNPDWANCVKLVQADFVNLVKNVLGKATVENILTLMDGETPQKINKALMNALSKKEDVVDPSAPRDTKPHKKEKKMTPAEKKQWLRNLDRGII